MQSHCIYAEAFAGPFRPLRAPEPPFTHKTPPFTQVLFLFDAFYGTISLRKSSSLCSYKTESEVSMKKRILALLLAFSMMLSLLPVSALADTGGGIGSAGYASNGLIGGMPDLVMGSNGMPDHYNADQISEFVYQGNGWRYEFGSSHTLILESGKYDFNYINPGTRDGGTLNEVKCNIIVQKDAEITGGSFACSVISNYGKIENSLLATSSDRQIVNENGGSITNSIFLSLPSGVVCHSLVAVDGDDITVTLNGSAAYKRKQIFFTGTPTLTVKVDNNPIIQYINGEERYGRLTDPDGKGYQTFTPKAGDDVVLNRKPYVTDLVMTPGGFLDTTGREPIYDSAKNVIGCKGKGWKYENGTLTLESGEYDFTHTEPRNTASSRYGDSVKCNIVVEENAEITGGILAGNSLTNSGTVKDILFMGYWLTNNNGTLSCLLDSSVYDHPSFTRHTVTAVDGSQIYYTVNQQSTGNGKQLYFTGTPKFTVKLEDSDILCINGDKYYGGLKPSEPSEPSDVHGYYTFTPPVEENIVLNREPYATDLVITEDGFPDMTGREPIYDPANHIIGCKGEGWKYESGTLTLESGRYQFIHEDGDSTSFTTDEISCNVIVQNGVSVTGGYFKQPLVNYGTIERAAIYRNLENHNTISNSYIFSNADQITNSGSMDGCLFEHQPNVFKTYSLSEVEDYYIEAYLNGVSASTVRSEFYFTGTPTLKVQLVKDSDFKKVTYINGKKNYGGLNGPDVSGYYTFTPEQKEDIVLNDSIIHEPFTMTNGYPTASNGGKTACKGEGWEYILGNPEHGDFLFLSDAQIDFSKISDGSPVECKLFIGHGVAVQGGTFNGDVINNGGGILGGTFNGAVENHGTIENGVFNGAVTNIDPGTVSDSITGTGTLNGKPITPNAYTLTVTGGGLVNGKTSAVVEAGDEVRLTVGEMQEGMSFNYWDLPTALTKALTAEDFSNKVEPLTFTMPDLSGYTEDTRFTIRLDIRPAELPDDDDGPSVLGTMATVAVGGAAAGILVWQGVSLGVDSYLQLSLPGGVPVPANRIELVKLLWETAGKPDVVLPALYGDVSAEDGELQKATRWAIDNGLVKSADETDASRFDPDRSVSKYEVARAWFKVQQMLK